MLHLVSTGECDKQQRRMQYRTSPHSCSHQCHSSSTTRSRSPQPKKEGFRRYKSVCSYAYQAGKESLDIYTNHRI